MLMLSINRKHKTKKALYSVTEGKIFKNINLNVFFAKRFSGFSHGWLATVDEAMAITLVNPFKNPAPKITLPSLRHSGRSCDSQFCVLKVILSADPTSSPNNYVVVTIYSGSNRLAFIKPKQEATWTYIDDNRIGFTDIIFYKSLVYAVGSRGWVVSFDVHGENNDSSQQLKPNALTPMSYVRDSMRAYFVESSKGDLLMVRRFGERKSGMNKETTETFEVRKLLINEMENGSVKQVEVKSFGDETLFLGDNHSMSILASHFPGCHPNSIYFTDDNIDTPPGSPYRPDGHFDMGIFFLEDGTFNQHYTPKRIHKYLAPPLWVVPPVLQ